MGCRRVDRIRRRAVNVCHFSPKGCRKRGKATALRRFLSNAELSNLRTSRHYDGFDRRGASAASARAPPGSLRLAHQPGNLRLAHRPAAFGHRGITAAMGVAAHRRLRPERRPAAFDWLGTWQLRPLRPPSGVNRCDLSTASTIATRRRLIRRKPRIRSPGQRFSAGNPMPAGRRRLRKAGYRFAKALKARNATLRSDTPTLSLWPSAKVRTKVTRFPISVTASAEPTI